MDLQETLYLMTLIAVFVIVIFIGSVIKYFKISPRLKKDNLQKYYEVTVFLGSGGHTGELSLMLQGIDFQKLHKLNIIITSTDKSSKKYFQNTISKLKLNNLEQKVSYHQILRTNEVKQSYFTSIFSTLRSFFVAVRLIRNQLINTTHFISNGPGTCVPLFLVFNLTKKFKINSTKLIFIESWCRVNSLSLSGKIVRFFVDKFIVHWEQQKIKYPWATYSGKIL